MKLLVLTTRLFAEPTSGGEICTARLLQALALAGHELVLAGRGDAAAAAPWARRVVSLGSLEPPFDEQPPPRRLLAVAGAMLAGLPVTAYRQGRPQVARDVAPLLHEADAVVVDHLQAWPWVGTAPARPLMLVQHNVESDNYLRRGRAANRGYQGNPSTRSMTRYVMRRESQQLRRLELDALARAAVVACLSEADAARMRELAARAGAHPQALLTVLPGYPLRPLPRPAGLRRRGGAALPALGLIGTWTWAPNREGLLWLLQHVWPALRGRARLVLAGSGLDGLPLPPDAQVLGRVADVGRFFDAVDALALPVLTGSGVQEKAIEAIATGLPVVATRHALRGLGEALPAHVHRAGDAAGFARACLAALGEPRAAAGVAEDIERWSRERRLHYAEALSRSLQALHAAARPGTAGGLPLAVGGAG